MGVTYNNRIVTDGLILCLDTASKRSYPGTGTNWSDLVGDTQASFINMDASNFTNANGGLLSMDGSNEYMQGSTNLGLSGDPDFTIGHWIYWDHDSWNGNYPNAVGNSSTWSTGRWLGTSFHAGRIAIDYWVTRFRASSSSTLDVKTWYYVAFTKASGSNNATNTRLYINGENVSGAAEGGTSVNILDSSVKIGLCDPGTGYTFRRWQGYVNNITVYNRVLTVDEIRRNYLSTKERYL